MYACVLTSMTEDARVRLVIVCSELDYRATVIVVSPLSPLFDVGRRRGWPATVLAIAAGGSVVLTLPSSVEVG